MRLAIAASIALLLAATLLVAAGAAAAPSSRECSDKLSDVACASAVDAVLRRGLPGLHPLILAVRIEPGSAPEPSALGHRATVEFDLLGVPDPTTIELWYDQGSHWGGSSDRDEAEVVAWALAPLLVAGLVSVAMLGLAWRRRSPTTE